MKTFKETDPMTVRAGDPPIIKVTREVPLTWLLSTVGTIVSATLVFAGTVYFTQQRQIEQLIRLEKRMDTLADQYGNMVLANQDKDTSRAEKLQKHEFQIQDLQRRMDAVELKGAKR